MRYRCLLGVVVVLMTSCSSLPKPAYLKEFPPGTQLPGRGVSFTIPDEEGWHLFDPDGKGAIIGRRGRYDYESYTITLDDYSVPFPQSEEEFINIYNYVKHGEVEPPRYISITANEQMDYSRGKYFLLFYVLTEDHEARKMPPGQKYMLLETTGYFAVHPDNPNRIVRVAYSNRYSPGHEDVEFKKKAKWVLGHTAFTKP